MRSVWCAFACWCFACGFVFELEVCTVTSRAPVRYCTNTWYRVEILVPVQTNNTSRLPIIFANPRTNLFALFCREARGAREADGSWVTGNNARYGERHYEPFVAVVYGGRAGEADPRAPVCQSRAPTIAGARHDCTGEPAASQNGRSDSHRWQPSKAASRRRDGRAALPGAGGDTLDVGESCARRGGRRIPLTHGCCR